MSTSETTTEAVFSAPKHRKRGILALGLAVALATFGIGATYASVTVETVLPGSSVTADLQAGIDFKDGNGKIVKNISPGQSVEEYIITGVSVANVPGHVMLSVEKFDMSTLPDGFLDNTDVQITINEINYPGTPKMTLRDFVTKGFGVPRVEPGAEVKYSVVLTPATTAEGFTAEDLGSFKDSTFDLKFTFSGIGDDGQSDLSEYVNAHGQKYPTIGSYILAIPNGEIKGASEKGVTAETVTN